MKKEKVNNLKSIRLKWYNTDKSMLMMNADQAYTSMVKKIANAFIANILQKQNGSQCDPLSMI